MRFRLCPRCINASFIFSLVLLSCARASVYSVQVSAAQADPVGAFEQWALTHQRQYLNDPLERAVRYGNFRDTVSRIAAHDSAKGPGSMTLGLNGFADWTDDEFRRAYVPQGQQFKQNPLRAGKQLAIEDFAYAHDKIVIDVDWRTKGVVGPIKNQHPNGAPCGCCWSFATTAAAECTNAMYTGTVVSLSEQQLIDCDRAPPYEDQGCKGGDFGGGLHYIITHGGIDTEEDYPYTASDGKCNRKKASRNVVSLDAWEAVPPGNETALQQAVARHPVAVGVCVGPGDNILAWRSYTGGIFEGPNCETPIDHAMLIVGYGSEGGKDFWIVKNSWGPAFGEAGYIRFPRGLGGYGANSIAHEPAYAIKLHDNPKSDAAASGLIIERSTSAAHETADA